MQFIVDVQFYYSKFSARYSTSGDHLAEYVAVIIMVKFQITCEGKKACMCRCHQTETWKPRG